MATHLLLALLVLLSVGCGGDASSPPNAGRTSAESEEAGEPTEVAEPEPAALPARLPCKPKGSALSITAKNLEFSTKCLAAPADMPFTIRLTNHDTSDSIPPGDHNIGIYMEKGYRNEVFSGKPIVDATVTYEVDALATGLYFFRCDVHPSLPGMQGSLVVR